MHDGLWEGVQLKAQNAAFFLEEMGRSLQPPERAGTNVVLQSTGALIDSQWQQSFYPRLDAFLAMCRSVPEIINCCFGKDISNLIMKTWFNNRSNEERGRRKDFSNRFEADYIKFRELPLSTARNIALHRKGYPPVTVNVSGRFGVGVTYTGSPIKRVPSAETPPITDGFGWLSKPFPVQPMWSDFTIGDKPLFPECRTYLEHAQNLVLRAQSISQQVHRSLETDGT